MFVGLLVDQPRWSNNYGSGPACSDVRTHVCIRESKKAETHVTSTTHHRTIEKLNDDPTQRRVAEMLGLEFLRPRGQCEGADIRKLAISKPESS